MLVKAKKFIEDGGLFPYTGEGFVDNFITIFSNKPYIEVSVKKQYLTLFILNRLKRIKDILNLGKIGLVVKLYRKIVKPLI